MLRIKHHAGDGGRTVVVAEGQVDLASAPQLSDALAQAQREGVGEIAVDLSKVDFLDSVGVRVLVEAARNAAAAQITLSIEGAQGWVARVLEITGVQEYLRIVNPEPAGSGDPEH